MFVISKKHFLPHVQIAENENGIVSEYSDYVIQKYSETLICTMLFSLRK